jgi:hypothetical protein
MIRAWRCAVLGHDPQPFYGALKCSKCGQHGMLF